MVSKLQKKRPLLQGGLNKKQNDGIFCVRRQELCLHIWHEGYHHFLYLIEQ